MLFFSAQQISGRLGLPCLGRVLLKNTIGMSTARRFRAHSLQPQKNKNKNKKNERRQKIKKKYLFSIQLVFLSALFSRDKPRGFITFCFFCLLRFYLLSRHLNSIDSIGVFHSSMKILCQFLISDNNSISFV